MTSTLRIELPMCRGGVGGRKDQTYTYVKTAQADGVFILGTLLSFPLQNRWKNNLNRTDQERKALNSATLLTSTTHPKASDQDTW